MSSRASTSSPSAALSWRAIGRTWPHHTASRFVNAGGMRWHVQEMGPTDGEAPVLFLLHGAGASTHSWRDVMAGLAAHFRVIAVDLPGHAFSDCPRDYRPTLQRVSTLLGELIHVLGVDVRLAVGHSAGAATLARMTLDHRIAPAGLVSFNGAFQPFDGAAGAIFPALAKLLFVNPLTPRLFALGGRSHARVERLIEGTGSRLPDDGLSYYRVLMQSPGHIAGVLGMMAHWELTELMRELPSLKVPLLLIAGENDRAVPPKVSQDVAKRCQSADIELWPGLGHLAHEEAPEHSVERIVSFAQTLGVLAEPAQAHTQN
ncbi:MAG: alpha/beta fold hydrolase [Hyphomicrobiales bacterium]|jgi:magnesium chelatase accessory protein